MEARENATCTHIRGTSVHVRAFVNDSKRQRFAFQSPNERRGWIPARRRLAIRVATVLLERISQLSADDDQADELDKSAQETCRVIVPNNEPSEVL